MVEGSRGVLIAWTVMVVGVEVGVFAKISDGSGQG